MISTGRVALDITPGTMNPPGEGQSAGQESVHEETTGGAAPPIRTTSGLPADREKLRDGVSTVCKYLKRAEAAGVTWPLPEGWDDARVEAVLFRRTASPAKAQRAERSQPDFAAMHEPLWQHRHLTLQLLWEEYRQANPEGYRYSRFCELYQRWRSKLDVVLRQEHKAGEKMFVDWAGSTIPVYDRHTGIAWQAPLFVAALGASSYTWAEATRDQQTEAWLQAHVHAFEHFGGMPALVVPDNAKTGVTRAHRYDPDLNPTYYNFALIAVLALYRRDRISRATKPKLKMPFKLPSAGSWRRCATASSSRSKS